MYKYDKQINHKLRAVLQKINETNKSKIYIILNNKQYYILYLSKSNLNKIDLKFLTRLMCLSAGFKLFHKKMPLTQTLRISIAVLP